MAIVIASYCFINTTYIVPLSYDVILTNVVNNRLALIYFYFNFNILLHNNG